MEKSYQQGRSIWLDNEDTLSTGVSVSWVVPDSSLRCALVKLL